MRNKIIGSIATKRRGFNWLLIGACGVLIAALPVARAAADAGANGPAGDIASSVDGNDSNAQIFALHRAVEAGDFQTVRAMCELHPEWMNAPLPVEDDSQRLTPLHTAVAADRPKLVEYFLDHGVNIEDRVHGDTPLMRAAIEGHNDIIEILLERGADIDGQTNAADIGDVTPIRAAQLYGHPATAQFLADNGARVDFFSAAGLGWMTSVMHDLGMDPSLATATDHWGFQPAWLAVNTGKADVVKVLMDRGAAIDGVYGMQEFTALHIAAERGYRELAIELLDHGFNINARDRAEKTPLRYAIDHHQNELAAILRSRGAGE